MTFSALSLSLFASAEPLHVDLNIYSNKSFLNKSFSLMQHGEINTIVPAYTNLENLRYEISDGCKVQKQSLSFKKEKQKDEEVQKLSDTKDKLTYEIEALKAKEILLKSLTLNTIEEITKADEVSQYLTNSLIQNFQKTKTLKQELANIEELLKEKTTATSYFKEFNIAFTCKDIGSLNITYPINELSYNSFYDINANTENKSVSIEKKVSLDYKGVESFERIDLNIYSYSFNQNVAPNTFYPKYLSNNQIMPKAKALMAVQADAIEESTIQPRIIEHENLTSKSVYSLKDISLSNKEKNLLHVDTEMSDANFISYIDAYGTNKAYIQASFKMKKDYSKGVANLFLDSNPISSRQMKNIKKGVIQNLYFGEDEHIQISKELIKTLDEKTFFGDKKVSTQNWKYTIKNAKPFSTKVNFVQRVPVSKDGDIEVKTFAQPSFDAQDAQGKTEWNFTLEPTQSKNIIFGYEVSNSK